jgi:hypothetical protein
MSTGIVITIDAEPGLSTVTLGLDGATLTASEATPGKYTASTLAPSRTGTYPITVTLKNILSQTTVKNDAATLMVTTPVVAPVPKAIFRNVVVMMDGTKVNLNFSVENLPANTTNFKIAYGESADALGSEVTTYTLDKIKKPNGTYNWYIPGLVAKSYTFKIFGMDGSGAVMSDVTSDPVSLAVGVPGACTIGNVTSLRAETLADKTVLSWDTLSGAISYNIYRINASKDLELIKNVTTNTYTIDLAP